MADWFMFGLGLATFAIVQWGLLSLLPMSLTYYVKGKAQRRRLSLGQLIRHAMKRDVEIHGSLLYVDTGHEKGIVGGNWATMSLAVLVVGPWVMSSELKQPPE